MQKHIEIAKKISKDLDSNGLNYLEDVNIHNTFKEIYRLNISISTANLIVAFIIYAYNPDSGWIDIRKDRYDNKIKILSSIGLDINLSIVVDILSNGNETINEIILNYLSEITDYRWPMIYSLFDYHSNMIRFVNQKTETEKSFEEKDKDGNKVKFTEEYEIDKIAKVHKQKGELLEQAIQSREKGEKLLSDIKKDFVATDHAVQQDFGFNFTDTAKKNVDIPWREFIKDRNAAKVTS